MTTPSAATNSPSFDDSGPIRALSRAFERRANERFTGRFLVESLGIRGELRLADGQLVHAQMGPTTDAGALVRVLLADEGTFVVEDRTYSAKPAAPAALVALSEAWTEVELLREAAEQVGGLSRAWTLRFRALDQALKEIPREISPLLRLLDGTRSVRDLFVVSPLPPRVTIRVLSRLLGMGILVLPDAALDGDRDAIAHESKSTSTGSADAAEKADATSSNVAKDVEKKAPADAAKDGAKKSPKVATKDVAKKSPEVAAKDGAKKAPASDAAKDGAKKSSKVAAKDGAKKSPASDAAKDVEKKAPASDVAKDVAKKSPEDAAQDVETKATASDAAKDGAKKSPASDAAKDGAKKSPKVAAEDVEKKAPEDAAQDVAKKAPASDAAKEVEKKAPAEAAKDVEKKSPEHGAKDVETKVPASDAAKDVEKKSPEHGAKDVETKAPASEAAKDVEKKGPAEAANEVAKKADAPKPRPLPAPESADQAPGEEDIEVNRWSSPKEAAMPPALPSEEEFLAAAQSLPSKSDVDAIDAWLGSEKDFFKTSTREIQRKEAADLKGEPEPEIFWKLVAGIAIGVAVLAVLLAAFGDWEDAQGIPSRDRPPATSTD